MLYSGEQFDPNLQMQYLRARYYDQNNGRFNRADPFSGNRYDPQSLHKYAYAHSDPVSNVDPSGEAAGSLIGMVSVVAIQAVLYTMVLGAVLDVVTGGEFYEGLHLTLYYLTEASTWLVAAMNVVLGIASLIDPVMLGYILILVIGNIATGGVLGFFTGAYFAIKTVASIIQIAAKGIPTIIKAKLIAVILATIIIGLILAVVIVGVIKLIGTIIGKLVTHVTKLSGKTGPIQIHHKVPWNNKTFNHQNHPLVKQSGMKLKTSLDNQMRLGNHAGRHSSDYHKAVSGMMDKAYMGAVNKGQEAAKKVLLDVFNQIENAIKSSKLQPYNTKAVWIP